jgi:hypothetical protein
MNIRRLGRAAKALIVSVIILIAGLPAQEVIPQKVDPFQLALILKSARQYCQRLEKAALDFVCQEEVSEFIDLTRYNEPNLVTRVPSVSSVSGGWDSKHRAELRFDPPATGKTENTYLFDYQFVRKAGEVKENRALLEKNGKKAGQKDAPPKTEAFQFADILLAPVRLLDERFGDYYDYRLLREDELNGVKAWVLDVVPRLSVVDVYLGGKIWLAQEDSSVLRIDWDPSTFGKYESILLRAKKYESQPEVASYTEFGFEKNGLRFPSLDLTEEAYVGQDGKKFVRAVTKIVYKDYKFFTVETETDFQK